MKHYTIAFFILLTFVGFSFPQKSIDDTDEWEVSICPVILIGGGTTDFNGTISYVAKTDKNGQVVDISQGRKTTMGKHVDLKGFIPCVKGWNLSPSEEHNITFGIGTIHFDRNPNYISVTSKTKKLKIILPIEIFEWNAKKITK